MLIGFILGIVLLTIPWLSLAAAQQPRSAWGQTQRIEAVDADDASDFGDDVAVDGDTAVVGAPYADTAYIYTRTGAVWTVSAVLTGPASFGHVVDVSDETVVVGAPSADAASVYEPVNGDWTETGTLSTSAPGQFGSSVAVDGDTVIVGDLGASTVHVFERAQEAWVQVQSFTEDERFGFSVAIDADTFVAAGASAGAIVFEHSGTGWAKSASLGVGSGWDPSVDVSGDTIVVGDSRTQTASVFEQTGDDWSFDSRLSPSDASPFSSSDNFGTSVSVGGGTIVVGAPSDDASPGPAPVPETERRPCVSQFGFGQCLPTQPGAAYVFEEKTGGWVSSAKLVADEADDDRFGWSTDLDSDESLLLVGAPYDVRNAVGGAIDVDIEDSVHVFAKMTDP